MTNSKQVSKQVRDGQSVARRIYHRIAPMPLWAGNVG